MDAEREPGQGSALAELFRVTELPRWRAVFALTCAGGAFLAAGGMLEYGTGSPETHGVTAASYWAMLFAVHVAALGGTALLAAFPALARRPIKLVWLIVTALLYASAFAVWRGHHPEATVSEWWGRSTTYAPAGVAVLIGLLLSPRSGIPAEKTDDR